ncbi:MAG: molybdenum cofactor guanylyltransferase MobA [Rhizobiales bacterium]|nr:molybdenum cofactor guanylyltransferase MobA [Hyphomicrobiales bacterium]
MDGIVIAGCILAGGRSRRMGHDKRFAKLANRTLIEHAIARLTPQVDCLLINANDDPSHYAATGLPVRADPVADFAGPLAGILAALLWAEEINAKALITVPSDAPFFPADLVARLDAVSDRAIVSARSGGRLHPVFSLWRRPATFIAPLWAALEGEASRKVESFIARFPHGTVDWPAKPHDPFFNINTPADLAEAERILAVGVS